MHAKAIGKDEMNYAEIILGILIADGILENNLGIIEKNPWIIEMFHIILCRKSCYIHTMYLVILTMYLLLYTIKINNTKLIIDYVLFVHDCM